MLWLIPFDPVERAVEKILEKIIMPNHFDKANNGDRSEIEEKLCARGLQLDSAEAGHFQIRVLRAQIGQQERGVLIARMLSRDEEQIRPPADRFWKIRSHWKGARHHII